MVKKDTSSDQVQADSEYDEANLSSDNEKFEIKCKEEENDNFEQLGIEKRKASVRTDEQIACEDEQTSVDVDKIQGDHVKDSFGINSLTTGTVDVSASRCEDVKTSRGENLKTSEEEDTVTRDDVLEESRVFIPEVADVRDRSMPGKADKPTSVDKTETVPTIKSENARTKKSAKHVSDTVDKECIKRYLKKRIKTKTLAEIYNSAMENNAKKNELLETLRFDYLKGRIPTRDYFEAIYLQIGELSEGPLATNPQTQMIDAVHFDEIREFMPIITNYDNEHILHFLSLYCNS